MSVMNDQFQVSTFIVELDRFGSLLKIQPAFEKLIRQRKEVMLFLSLGYEGRRATVFTVKHPSFDKAWESLKRKAVQYLQKFNTSPQFFKIDFVDQVKPCQILEFIEIMTHTKKNYFRQGVSFDDRFEYAFIEQEINGNAFIQIDSKTNRGYLHEVNIQRYIKGSRPNLKPLDFNNVSQVYTFTTVGFFYHNGSLLPLKNEALDNGRRDTPLDRNELKHMIVSAGDFLTRNVRSDGKFTYGYFSCFDTEIKFYNMLRHASTIYSMCEVYECFPNDELLEAIKRGLNYLIVMGVVHVKKDNEAIAYVVDGVDEKNKEIKLGANAAAILALTKYMEITDQWGFLLIAEQLARGIVSLQNEDGSFNHVLHYPSFELKEAFRIVYYDGEAAFALMKLCKLSSDDIWLQTVERAFDYFIQKDHWKHHDHWLSYCTNELTSIKPLRKYFQFGLRNVKEKLGFIYHRATTYPTFLELTLAAYQMIERLLESEHRDLIETENFDIEKLLQTIHKRAEYQRNGYFYPEMAMYFKNPRKIMGSFFIRHHSFRVRIDDVEHNLSGYCRYYKLFTFNGEKEGAG